MNGTQDIPRTEALSYLSTWKDELDLRQKELYSRLFGGAMGGVATIVLSFGLALDKLSEAGWLVRTTLGLGAASAAHGCREHHELLCRCREWSDRSLEQRAGNSFGFFTGGAESGNRRAWSRTHKCAYPGAGELYLQLFLYPGRCRFRRHHLFRYPRHSLIAQNCLCICLGAGHSDEKSVEQVRLLRSRRPGNGKVSKK